MGLCKERYQTVVKAAAGKALVKVIIETCLLTDERKNKSMPRLQKEAGADFVKTSTGFSTGGAKVEDIRLMRETVGPDMGVKASGGVRDFERSTGYDRSWCNKNRAKAALRES